MSATPVVFIHGLWLHSSSWQGWADTFTAAGYVTSTPLWPGEHSTIEDTRAHPETQAGKGLAEIISHHADFVATFDTKPIVIGHSFGGLIAQSLVDQNLAAAAVAIDPAQIRGVLPLPFPQLKSAFHTVPHAVSKAAYKLYKHSTAVTDLQEIDRGHSLTVDHGWSEVAQISLDWLGTQGL
jgi:pimeloyl-ACP methyl ester carboxylesterase